MRHGRWAMLLAMIEAFAGLVVLTVLAAVLCGLLLGVALLGRAVLGGPDGDVLGFVGGVAVPLLR